MDHLLLPHDPISQHLQVPLVCDINECTTHTFLQYPLHAYSSSYSQFLDSTEWSLSTAFHSAIDRKEELKAFLQGWLYFSLLRTFLSPLERYDLEESTERIADEQYVHSRKLCQKLDTWVCELQKRHKDEIEIVISELGRCLAIVKLTITVGGHFMLETDSDGVWSSIIALLEVLDNALAEITPKALSRAYWPRHTLTRNARDRLRSHGWCPFEIHSHFDTALQFSVGYFLEHMSKPESSDLHEHCSDLLCQHVTITTDYQTQHVSADCRCEDLGPTFENLAKCLDVGVQPILDISGSCIEDLKLSVLSSKPSRAYVALSHVWSDGLGNRSANTLKRCQLLRLHGMVKGLENRRFTTWVDKSQENDVEMSESKIYLWCDTLCCPVQSKYKEKSLATMASVYRDSTYTLVLDASIETHSLATIGPFEAAMRIATSKWAHRLWTLQEAALPKKLLFKFADGVHDLRDIWRELDEKNHNGRIRRNRATHAFMRWAHNYFVQLRAWFRPDLWETNKVERFQALSNFMQRRVSEPMDEPLCLAALLGQDITGVAKPERMETLWKRVAQNIGISQTIIFNKLPRLHTLSMRWAPSTILAADDDLLLDFGANDDVKAILTEQGLLVTGKRLVLETNILPFGFRDEMVPRSDDPGTWTSVLLRDMAGTWFQIKDAFAELDSDVKIKVRQAPGTIQDNMHGLSLAALLHDHSKKWHLVYNENERNPNARSVRALLAHEEAIVNDKPLLRSMATVSVINMTPLWNEMYRHGERYAMALQHTWLAKCLRRLSRLTLFLQYLAAFLPSRSIVRLHFTMKALETARKIIEKHWSNCLIVALSHAQRAGLVKQLHQDDNPLRFGLFVTVPYIGRHIRVQSEHDPAEQCYID